MTRQTGDAVLVTDATQRLLCLDHGGFDARPAAPLKGKRERVQLWAPRALTRARGRRPEPDGEHAWRRVGVLTQTGPGVLPGPVRVRSSMKGEPGRGSPLAGAVRRRPDA